MVVCLVITVHVNNLDIIVTLLLEQKHSWCLFSGTIL